MDVLMGPEHRDERDDEGHALPKCGGQRRARDLQARKAELAVDEQVVEYDVDHVGGGVVEQGGARIARAAQRVGDGGGQRQEGQAQHLHPQVLRAAQQRLLVLRAHEADQRLGKHEAQHREHQREQEIDHQRLAEHQLRLVLAAGALVARDHGHAADVERVEHG